MRTTIILLFTIGCADSPTTLDPGTYNAELRLTSAGCPTEPVALEGGWWSCPTGSFSTSADEVGEQREALRCATPLEPSQVWSVGVQTQERSILGLVDTSRAFTIYSIQTDLAELGTEIDGDETGGYIQGGAPDSFGSWSAWGGTFEVTGANEFSLALRVLMQTLDGGGCLMHYDIVARR